MLERYEAYDTYHLLYKGTVFTSESIKQKFIWWFLQTQELFAATKSLEHILAFSLVFDGLEPLKPLVMKLQKRNQDIYKTYQITDTVISELKRFRDHLDVELEYWFNFSVKLREEVNTVPSVPRLAKSWSRFRPNVENNGSLSYNKRSLAIRFLNNINSQLEYRLKDRNHIEIFVILRSIMLESDYNLEVTVKILLGKYHNEMINEGGHFGIETMV